MHKYTAAMKRLAKCTAYVGAALFSMAAFQACNEDIDDSAYYTFTGQTVASFSEDDPRFSTFNRIIQETGTNGLLSTYGHYTCFMPTDDAFMEYFNRKGISYEDLSADEKIEIVYNHVVMSVGTDYSSDYFEEGSLPETSMSGNYLTISYQTDEEGSGLRIFINKTTPIIERDNEVHNGIVHVVGALIEPSKEFLNDIIEAEGNFTIFASAMRLTGYDEKTSLLFDESFVPLSETGEVMRDNAAWKTPAKKRYGFTLFAEPDDVMAANGIRNLSDLEAFAESCYGTVDRGNYHSIYNALNKFVAYHILDRQMSTNSFLYNGVATETNRADYRAEYYETMLSLRLMEIRTRGRINVCSDGSCVTIDETRSNLSAMNGFVHSINSMLVYDENVMVNDVLNKRLRFDFYNMPPELTNNNIRWQLSGLAGYNGYIIPNNFCSEHLTFSDETIITMWASSGWSNFEEDEMMFGGWYDFTLRMLPVPPGSYEIRLGYRQENWRGIAQLFVDGEIQGIPIDLRIAGTDPQVGWVADTDGPADAENDKAMRNRGYMKAPASIHTNQEGGISLRGMNTCLRVILGQFTFQEYAPHYLRGKNVYDPNQVFHADYIEIIPTSLIEKEDIY